MFLMWRKEMALPVPLNRNGVGWMLLSETPNPTKTNYTQKRIKGEKQQINALLFVQTKSRQLSLSFIIDFSLFQMVGKLDI